METEKREDERSGLIGVSTSLISDSRPEDERWMRSKEQQGLSQPLPAR